MPDNQIVEDNTKIETLESEIKLFTNNLPYWAKYIAEIILSGKNITEEDFNKSYSFLLEDLDLLAKTNKPEIKISYNPLTNQNYKSNLLLSKIDNIEGVNALVENQIIEFNPQLTILYGVNGSGKSGYVRLLKKVFYSKSPEEILPNIHIENDNKSVNARFVFTNNDEEIPLKYKDSNNAEFKQFAVFDGKSVLSHLEQKNEFEFRPAGLGFFSEFTEAIKKLESKLVSSINEKKVDNNFTIMFEGSSEIKTLVENFSENTKIEDLKKYTPFSSQDKIQKEKLQKDHDELLLSLSNKDKEIKSLENIKNLIKENKQKIELINKYFTIEKLANIKIAISNYIAAETVAKSEGIEKFKTDRIKEMGSTEWKVFIEAAEKFALKQKSKDNLYPEKGDNCLFCQQPLSEEARNLITNYWDFVKSVAEENAKKEKKNLNKLKQEYIDLDFDLYPKDNTLSVWLIENHEKSIENNKKILSEQKALTDIIISDIENMTVKDYSPCKINTDELENIESIIGSSIKSLQSNEQTKGLEKILNAKILLEHKEKFNTHFSKFESFVSDQIWISKANKADFSKRKITDTEKALSNKYFNKKYIDLFNSECKKLNGNFGIEINHTGTAGKSYRQLKIKGNNPNVVLSEGEQKVIAISDFISEMSLSEINRGIIFDDPVNSLDETRKSEIAERLVQESKTRQTIIFSHDLVFVSALIGHSTDLNINYSSHWIENRDGKPGQVWLNNSPSFEKQYRNAEPSKKHLSEAKKETCPPSQREFLLKSGFAALRTCYEVLVINDLFKNVVQRFNERVSIDSLSSVYFDNDLIVELQDSFAQCCRYMEGHSHSDKYAYKKPDPSNLQDEIQRYESIRQKIKKIKRPDRSLES